MTATPDSPHCTYSPRAGGLPEQSPRAGSNLHSPWAQVVRGDPESVPAIPNLASSLSMPSSLSMQTHSSDFIASKASLVPLPAVDNPETGTPPGSSDASNSNGDRPKPVWNKPSKGIDLVDHVMDAVSWPALSESTRPTPKSPSDSSKNIPILSVSVSQGHSIPVSPQKQSPHSATNSPTPNHNGPARQRSMKRGNSFGRGGSSSRSFPSPPPPPPPPPPFPVFRLPHNKYGNFIPILPVDPDNRAMGGLGLNPHAAVANGLPSQRNAPSRRGNFGPQNRKNYSSNRRDQNSDDYEWNSHHPSTFTCVSAPPRGFISPPPNTGPFIAPQPMRPFDMQPPVYVVPALSPEPLRGFPFPPRTPPPPPMLFTVPESPSLSTLIINQIDYYFSDANLMTDGFLKANMDDKGWVPITLIASFRRVQNLTDNIQLILDSLKNSSIVEVQGGKLRKRNDWMKWVSSLNPSNGESLPTTFKKLTCSADTALLPDLPEDTARDKTSAEI